MAEINKMETKDNTKEQWNQELVLWENQQDEQTLIQANQKADK